MRWQRLTKTWVVPAVVMLAGLVAIVFGAAASKYRQAVMLELGAAGFLFAPLWLLDRAMSQKVERTARQLDIVSEQLEATTRRLDELGQAFHGRIAASDEVLFNAFHADVSSRVFVLYSNSRSN